MPNRYCSAFTRRASGWRIGASVAASMLHGPVVHAQSAPDKALAEALFREGRTLLEAGQTNAACTKLEGSYRSDPKTGTLTNLAACHELQGKTASAWAEFTEAAARAATANRTGVAQLAHTRAIALEAKLSRLTVHVTAPAPDLVLTLDDRALVPEAYDTPIPLDPGVHRLVARRGEATWSAAPVIAPGPASADLVVPALEAPPPKPPAAAVAVVAPPPPFPATRPTLRRTVGYGVLGVGVAGLAVGTVFGIRTLFLKGDANALCEGPACVSQRGVDLQGDAHASATGSTLALGIGLAAVVVGVVLVWTAPSSHRARAAAWPLSGTF